MHNRKTFRRRQGRYAAPSQQVSYIVVTDQAELERHCDRIMSETKNHRFNYIAIDGEFYGYGAAYPKLSLLQIAYCDMVIVVDMMLDLDWRCLIKVLESEDILKVFHSCKHDVIALYNRLQCKISYIFDVQIAMLFLGCHKMVSYRYIVQKYFGIEIDKRYQNSNWEVRPLSNEQLTYAANDVYYLLRAYSMIENELGPSRYEIVLGESYSIISV